MESLKTTGTWKLDLYGQEATPSEVVGTIRFDRLGRAYRYAKAGATALGVGLQTTSPLPNADWATGKVPAAAAIGDKYVTLTIVDVDTESLAADYFNGGVLFVNDGVGEKYSYPIVSSTAVAADGTSITVGLEVPIVVALTAAGSQCTLVPNPWMGTVISTTETYPPTGVPLRDITAGNYYWSQTKGLGGYWGHTDVAALGSPLTLGTDDGALVPIVLDLNASADADITQIAVAYAYGVAGVDDEFKPCIYCID